MSSVWRVENPYRSPGAVPQSDGVLLRRFIDGRDAQAFADLMARHGPAVWNVCRRRLSRREDVEDAFQATFLVLVRQSQAISKQGSLKSWLIGVARRVAMRVLRTQYRRDRFLNQLAQQASSEAASEPLAEGELWRLVREELSALTEAQRNVIERCVLGDETYREASQQLGIPSATVASHVRRGREILKQRLTARGVSLTAIGAIAAAEVPAHVCAATVKNAGLLLAGEHLALPARVLSLTKGVAGSMAMTMKCICALALSLAGASAWLVASDAHHGGTPVATRQTAPPAQPPAGLAVQETEPNVLPPELHSPPAWIKALHAFMPTWAQVHDHIAYAFFGKHEAGSGPTTPEE